MTSLRRSSIDLYSSEWTESTGAYEFCMWSIHRFSFIGFCLLNLQEPDGKKEAYEAFLTVDQVPSPETMDWTPRLGARSCWQAFRVVLETILRIS